MEEIVSINQLLDEKYAKAFKSDNTELKLSVFKALATLDAPADEEQKLKIMVHIGIAQVEDFVEPKPELELLIDEAHKGSEAAVYPRIQSYIESHPDAVNTRFPNFLVTPLHAAACSGLKQTTQLLLAKGADRTAKNSCDETASLRCRGMGFSEIADMIDAFVQ